MRKQEILASLASLEGLRASQVTVSADSLCQILEQLLDFESRVQDGAILKEEDGYTILVKYYEVCSGVPVPFVGCLVQDGGEFYLDRSLDEYLEKQPELPGEPLASPTRCAEYILSSKRRLHAFLKWLEKESAEETEL